MILFLLVAGSSLVHGQLRDNIYLTNETSIGNVEIVEVSKKKVKYQNQQGKEFSFKAKEVLMVFNGQGNYLIFPNNAEQIEEFMGMQEKSVKADLIVTLSRNVIPVLIAQESQQEVEFQDLSNGGENKKLPTSKIAAIIYKSGRHKIFISPSHASNLLASLRKEIGEARTAKYKNPEEDHQDVFSSDVSANQKNTASPQPEVQEVAPPDDNYQMASLKIDPELYSRKALQKTTDLGTYLAIISDRNNDMKEANKAVELAIGLFINEDAQVEVSSPEGRSRYKVRAYLNRLKLLKYDKIEISWTDISYVSDLKKGMDGNYYGIITLQQRFKGFMDNQLVYSDLTEKNVEVKVMAYEKEMNGEKQEMWDVFLSDIGVVVTKID